MIFHCCMLCVLFYLMPSQSVIEILFSNRAIERNQVIYQAFFQKWKVQSVKVCSGFSLCSSFSKSVIRSSYSVPDFLTIKNTLSFQSRVNPV